MVESPTPKGYLLALRRLSSAGVDSPPRKSDAIRLHFDTLVHPPATSSSISLDMLDVGFYARSPLTAQTKVNHCVYSVFAFESRRRRLTRVLAKQPRGESPGVYGRTRDTSLV
jgi:hypothetical protein